MKIKFYVLDRELNVFSCFLLGKSYCDNYRVAAQSGATISAKEKSRIFWINSYQFYLLLNEIDNCPAFKYNFARYIKSVDSSAVIVRLIPNRTEYIDRTWGEIVRVLCWEQIEIQYMLSWLSTLGGGFSSLGDYYEDRAEIAGKISVYQMKIAYRIGDPNLLTRCKLYFSISLIQQNRFKLAQKIIREQYEFSKNVVDTRLRKMCLGIWAKLQYSHTVYRQNRKNSRRQKVL